MDAKNELSVEKYLYIVVFTALGRFHKNGINLCHFEGATCNRFGTSKMA